MAAVFLPQSTLQQWADQGKVRLQDTTLTLIKEQREVDLVPAVRFTSLLGGDEDPHKLVGKVKTKAQLDELGAEHYMDSVLHGDVAYQVVEGFMGDLHAAQRAPMPKAAAPKAVAPEAGAAPAAKAVPAPVDTSGAEAGAEGDDAEDAEALSRLFLDTVR